MFFSEAAVDATTNVKYYFFAGQRIAMEESSGSFRYLHVHAVGAKHHHLGSTVSSTNWGSGTYRKQTYYAYGARRTPSNSTFPTDSRFTDQKLDTTGLYYYNARYYDPEIGQFISPDTIVPDPTNLLDYNRYLYARGNSLKYTDPSGHFPIIIGAAIVLTGVALMVTADSPLPPEEAAKAEPSGRIGQSIVAGDLNDIAIVATGYDYINDEPVPYFSGEWFGAGAMAPLPLASMSLVKTAGKIGSDVAFGFTRNLGAFKRTVPHAQNFMNLGLNPYDADFADNVLEMMNTADNIHFDISLMRNLNGDDGILTGATRHGAGSTNWELRTIWDNPALLKKTTFYRYGKEISVEDILQIED